MAKRQRHRKRKGKPRGTVGRHPTGLQPGEKLSSYPMITARVPADVRDALNDAAQREGRASWRVLVDAIRAYVATAK